MSDTPIEKMDVKQLRNEVQLLRDELAVFKRKYEDIIYNLDNDNFSSRIVKEKDDMKAELKVTAEEISTKVSTDTFTSAMSQTADHISTIVSEFVDTSKVEEVNSPKDFEDTNKVYKIGDELYYFNGISKKWEIMKDSGMINSLFEQTENGFKLKGTVLVDGSCILTESLKFNSEDRPVEVQYSVTGTDGWHYGFSAGSDRFMRLKIGADWSAAMRVIGTDATVTTRNVFDAITNGATEQGLFSAFHNGGSKLYINAEYIQAGTLSGMQLENPGGDIRLVLETRTASGVDKGVFRLYNLCYTKEPYDEEPIMFFSVHHDGLGKTSFSGVSSKMYLVHDSGTSTTYPQGKWDFSDCSSLVATATFG